MNNESFKKSLMDNILKKNLDTKIDGDFIHDFIKEITKEVSYKKNYQSFNKIDDISSEATYKLLKKIFKKEKASIKFSYTGVLLTLKKWASSMCLKPTKILLSY